jgi:signal transduction histidine kinase
MNPATPASQPGARAAARPPASRWHRARHRLGHSIKLRLVLLFLLLAAAMTFVFVTGAQKAFSVGWREAARPLLIDYVDRLAADITVAGSPDRARARALTERLAVLTVHIRGPQVQWASHPEPARSERWRRADDGGAAEAGGRRDDWGADWPRITQRTTADGHTIEFGLHTGVFERRPRLVGYGLAALLLLTLLAWLYARHLLRPLDAIGEGARRFGAGDFSRPIVVRRPQRPDELGQLAQTINTMGEDIRQMLDAQRALLLAISHELRSPLTRARLHTELLPETPDTAPQREALLRDLAEMARLISDLLEGERLAGRHAALQREPTDLAALARAVITDLEDRHPAARAVTLHAPAGLPVLALDAARIRLLLRNLLDNALRHGAGADQPPAVTLAAGDAGGVTLTVRDHGPGVPDEQLARLAEPFYRPDSARTRAAGGVGLGLYLCRLVAQAHGGTFVLHNAAPGLAVTVTLPPDPAPENS